MNMTRYRRLMRGLVAVAGLALVAGACDKGLTALNENPNEPTDVPATSILPEAIRDGVGRIFGVGGQLRLTGLWTQLYAEIQYPDEDRYILRPSAIQGYWDGMYVVSLKDFQRIEQKGVVDGNPNYAAVGKTMKAWEFAAMTDIWGDIPYSEALQGDSTLNFQPKYDSQQSIYTDILAQLTAASNMIDASQPDFGSADLIYGGDMEKWRMFANSLRMRYAMRLVNVDPATAQSEFVAAYNAGVFTSNDDNAELDYLPANPNSNPWYQDWETRDDYGSSATLIDTLKSFNDPRITYYAEPAEADGVYRGMPSGKPNNAPGLASTSRLGEYWRANPGSTWVIMGYSEVLFLEAEAVERGWIAGNASQLYQDAIRANMTQFQDDATGGYTPYVASADIAAYLAQSRVQLSSDRTTALKQIWLQEWISFFGNSWEAYSTWRRTGVPDLKLAANNSQNQIPVRIPYPDLEQSLNADNWTAARTAQGLSTGFSTPVWWDAATSY